MLDRERIDAHRKALGRSASRQDRTASPVRVILASPVTDPIAALSARLTALEAIRQIDGDYPRGGFSTVMRGAR